jgi:hypothetical protein
MASRAYSDAVSLGKIGITWAAGPVLPLTSNATDRIPPDLIVFVRNTNASAVTLTLVTLDTADGDLAITDRTSVSIPATTGFGMLIIPNRYPYVDPADGLVAVNFSVSGATVTYALINNP